MLKTQLECKSSHPYLFGFKHRCHETTCAAAEGEKERRCSSQELSPHARKRASASHRSRDVRRLRPTLAIVEPVDSGVQHCVQRVDAGAALGQHIGQHVIGGRPHELQLLGLHRQPDVGR
eukprot:430731-Alexandrium_andersonii.AAC.1